MLPCLQADDPLIGPVWEPLDGGWLLATDPQNVGRGEQWFTSPRAEARPTKVPWIIQDAFPGYHGVAWYWRSFVAATNPNPDGRSLLRFWAVDYLAQVWLNGRPVGEHEGGESPFTLDVTGALRPGANNLLTVRVLNPIHEPVDGIVLNETPHRNKALPYTSGSAWNQGGIVDSVELLHRPAVRVDDLFARPDPATGRVRIETTLRNAGPRPTRARLTWSLAPAAGGETLCVSAQERELQPGESVLASELTVSQPRLWELNDPFLYRVTAQVTTDEPRGRDGFSVRCGFRDFRFADGAFRLNGRRVYLRCSHTGNCTPIGLELPHDPDLLRRDLINAKMTRFNAIRFIAGVPKRWQLDLCDEIGLMVYDESYAAWCLADSPHMTRRYDESVLGMIRRDRNHPSITIWGLLNETPDGPVFRHAVGLLGRLRELDDTRLVMLNSGRWDNTGRGLAGLEGSIGSLSNPGSTVWEDVLSDQHPYQRVPHTADIVRKLRTLPGNGLPVFLSEYGIGSAMDLVRVCRHYEQLGMTHVEDAQFYRRWRDAFLADYARFGMADVFPRPEDFFAASLERMAGQRLLGLNAIRANPQVVGHSMTGTVDQGMTGEGLWTTFRELKPGTTDALFDGWAPLRWCLFAEPANAARGTLIRVEAVLANEDTLRPGAYPARFMIVSSGGHRVWQRSLEVAVPDPRSRPEPPMVLPVLNEEVRLDGPAGEYRFLADFEQGAAAAGGNVVVHVYDPAAMPRVERPITLWGDDAELRAWLENHGVAVVPSDATAPARPEVILASGKPPRSDSVDATAVFADLARRMASGSAVVFLTPETLRRGDQPTGWLPLSQKGTIANLASWLYHKDEWCKRHPIFDGLPSGGLMHYLVYREIIPDAAFVGQEPPQETVAAGINAAQPYSSGVFVAVYRLGAGRFILNSLRIRENLGTSPVAERLLRNLLNYAASEASAAPVPLPDDLGAMLERWGYR